jgi:hypothetical protein
VEPLFDKYSFDAVFENHVHQMKITYPLTNSTVNNSSGTLYIGDGSWGIDVDPCPEKFNMGIQEGNLFQSYLNQDSQHIWIVNIFKNGSITYES